ncbi:membrane-spanning 4-domains subfamily A member 4A-like [Chanos chanos]|uniref:Membrane-spanning 4-domains subfamily A member 4A-like n=1 Tax=Chanos chanos TaxID=29144 RepID=A0A6J2W6G5_CHACN|nr:membrane-spanning 4-domains subfamily A member 4A-like [Chanos chanos]
MLALRVRLAKPKRGTPLLVGQAGAERTYKHPSLEMSGSVVTQNGFVVVTHVYPQQHTATTPVTGVSPRVPTLLAKFLRGEPKALGTVQILIGVMMLLFGIVLAVHGPSISSYSGVAFWGCLIYISSGSLGVAAENNLNKCLVKGSLVMNIFSTITAGISVILFSLDMVLQHYYHYCYEYDCYQLRSKLSSTLNGVSGVLLFFSLLQFVISITVSAFACKATCRAKPEISHIQIPGQYATVTMPTPNPYPHAYDEVINNNHLTRDKPADAPPVYTVS